MDLDPGYTRRLFRTDTPLDAFCAAIVAQHLPKGYNVLAICDDKSDAAGSREAWHRAFQIASAAYPWSNVVDLSGLPLARHRHKTRPRLIRIRDTLKSLTLLRHKLSTAFPQDDSAGRNLVDELYVTLPNHGDVLVLCQLLLSAEKYYCPHTFVSLMEPEITAHTPFISGPRAHQPTLRTWAPDVIKEFLFGRAMRPLRDLDLAGVYSFNEDPEWAAPTVNLSHLVTRELMGDFFSKLPSTIQEHFSKLAGTAGADCCVLFLSPPIQNRAQPSADEVAAYRYLVDQACGSGARSVLVKPHPRGSRAWSGAVIDQLRTTCDIPVVDGSSHAELPAEIVFSPFELSACAGLASNALVSFARIYGLTALFAQRVQQSLSVQQGYSQGQLEAWFRSAQQFITLV